MTPFSVGFECLLLVFLGICLTLAARTGPAAVLELVAAVAFGVAVEAVSIAQLHVYEYGRGLVMVGAIPLAVGVGWGVLLFSFRRLTDATTLPEWARPACEGLLGVKLDLVMDPIAVRLGMWQWKIGEGEEFFGVPWGNFWAWFWVIFWFSAFQRWLRAWTGTAAWWAAPVGAAGLGLPGVLASNTLLVGVVPPAARLSLIGLTLGVAFLLILALKPRGVPAQRSPLRGLPLAIMIYFLGCGLVSGVLADVPVLLSLDVLLILLGGLLCRRF